MRSRRRTMRRQCSRHFQNQRTRTHLHGGLCQDRPQHQRVLPRTVLCCRWRQENQRITYSEGSDQQQSPCKSGQQASHRHSQPQQRRQKHWRRTEDQEVLLMIVISSAPITIKHTSHNDAHKHQRLAHSVTPSSMPKVALTDSSTRQVVK